MPDAAFIYITEKRYPEGCSDTKKRAIRKKANSFVVRDGVMFFFEEKKDRGKNCMVASAYVDCDMQLPLEYSQRLCEAG